MHIHSKYTLNSCSITIRIYMAYMYYRRVTLIFYILHWFMCKNTMYILNPYIHTATNSLLVHIHKCCVNRANTKRELYSKTKVVQSRSFMHTHTHSHSQIQHLNREIEWESWKCCDTLKAGFNFVSAPLDVFVHI